jgi:hypothetical protein
MIKYNYSVKVKDLCLWVDGVFVSKPKRQTMLAIWAKVPIGNDTEGTLEAIYLPTGRELKYYPKEKTNE